MATSQASRPVGNAGVPDVAVVLIGHNDVGRLSAAVESVLAQTLAAGGTSYSIATAHRKYGFVYDLLTEPRIVACVKDILGPDVIGWGATPPNAVGVEFTRQAGGEAMPAASVIERGDMGSFWQTFVYVDDLDASTKKAAALGATPMGVPIETPGARILTCQDPGGAYFCMFSPNAELRATMSRA